MPLDRDLLNALSDGLALLKQAQGISPYDRVMYSRMHGRIPGYAPTALIARSAFEGMSTPFSVRDPAVWPEEPSNVAFRSYYDELPIVRARDRYWGPPTRAQIQDTSGGRWLPIDQARRVYEQMLANRREGPVGPTNLGVSAIQLGRMSPESIAMSGRSMPSATPPIATSRGRAGTAPAARVDSTPPPETTDRIYDAGGRLIGNAPVRPQPAPNARPISGDLVFRRPLVGPPPPRQ